MSGGEAADVRPGRPGGHPVRATEIVPTPGLLLNRLVGTVRHKSHRADWSLSFTLDTASFSPYIIFLALQPRPQAKGEPAEWSSERTPFRGNRKRTLIYDPKWGRAMPGKKQGGGWVGDKERPAETKNP